jgi:hypothetical protein
MREGSIVGGRFVLGAVAGAGGMSLVYRARDRVSGEDVAIKLLLGGSDLDGDSAERLVDEALVLAELRHPGVVRYIHHGRTDEGMPYLAMEWLEGEDLGRRLARGPLSPGEATALLARVAEALAAAHARGFVHRDIKPSNLFLVDRDLTKVKLLDFGIARLLGVSRRTRTGVVHGTPGYLAPEQASGAGVVDARTDLFALGCVVFECLTGRPPFIGDNLMAVLAKVLLEEAPRASQLAPDVPAALDGIVARLLAKHPSDRPPSAIALSAMLESGPPSPRPRLTDELGEAEQRLVHVVLVGEAAAPRTRAESAAATLLSAGAGAETELAAIAESHGGRLCALADGSFVAALPGRVAEADGATQAARCALRMSSCAPGRSIALATGRAPAARVPVGEVLDRAARLVARGAAAEGEIRIDDVTAGLLGRLFEVRDDEAGHLLSGERDLPRAARTLLGKPTAFVGRARELASLEAMVAECVEDEAARAVLVTARPGVGKSRLAQELLRNVAARREPAIDVWIAGGDPLSAGAAFALLSRLLRRVFDLDRGEPAETARDKIAARVARHVPAPDRARVAEFLGEIVGVPFPVDASAERVQLRAARANAMLMGDQIRRAFEDFLAAECAAHPVLIVLEDLHWGASSSRRAPACRATARPRSDTRWCARRRTRCSRTRIARSATGSRASGWSARSAPTRWRSPSISSADASRAARCAGTSPPRRRRSKAMISRPRSGAPSAASRAARSARSSARSGSCARARASGADRSPRPSSTRARP